MASGKSIPTDWTANRTSSHSVLTKPAFQNGHPACPFFMVNPMNNTFSRSLLTVALSMAISGCIHEDSSALNPNDPLKPVDPIPPSETIDYGQIIENWSFPMLLTEGDRQNPLYDTILDQRLQTARTLQAELIRDEPTMLWNTLPLYNDDGETIHNRNMASTFNNIEHLALAYRSFEEFHNAKTLDDILYALDFALENLYTETSVSTGNWYEWEIAVPKSIYDTFSLVHDKLPAALIDKANRATRYIVPDPNWQHKGDGATREPMESAGANRIDLALVVLFRGVFGENPEEIAQAIEAIPTVLDEVSTGNGFYADGSFIQHANIPYIGTYGLTLLHGVARVMDAVHQTGIDTSDPRYQTIDTYLFSALEPFLYDAKMMDAVNGRAIARGWVQNQGEGLNAISALVRFYESREGEVKQRLGKLIKHHILIDKERFFSSTSDLHILHVADKILNDAEITASEEVKGNFVFYNQDRMVHRGNGFALSVSLHSDRVGNYECLTTTKENLKGWYTGDGMTYLYDADHNQYQDWYALVDKRHLAGTTTDGATLPDCGGRRQYDNTKKDMTFVGGASNGEFGIYGADFYNHNDTLQAKKSYFGFGDKLVALGSDIQSNSGKAFTTINNFKLNELANNAIHVDGVAWAPSGNVTKTATNNFHIDGNVEGSQLGVYLPAGQSVKMNFHQRSGN
ncbi:hypothetical protein AT251_12635 [Enterovibrio nigricans]|nr:hypothetical protein AT251_12635 [Enterovibrio nigricans]